MEKNKKQMDNNDELIKNTTLSFLQNNNLSIILHNKYIFLKLKNTVIECITNLIHLKVSTSKIYSF